MQTTDFDVIIVGSGIVGATLACALLQGGMQVALIEAKPQTPPPLKPGENNEAILQTDLRTFALTRASERIFANLGFWEKITDQRISPYREMHVWDAGGSGEIHFDSADLHEPTLGHIVEQTVIQTALTARLAEFDNLTTYRPATVQRFHFKIPPNPPFSKGGTPFSKGGLGGISALQVDLDNGDSLTTRLLISAEGAHSSIRTQAGIPYQLRDHGQQAIVATVQTEQPHQETAWQRFLPTGPLAFLPLSDSHTSSIVWSIDTSLAQHLMRLESEAFQHELENAFVFKLGKVVNSGKRAAFPLQSRHVCNYVQPRLALVGDAAHSVLPLAGQGLNLGLLDAATISEVILNAHAKHRDFGNYHELRRYERWRKGDNFMMLKTMEGFKQLFGTQSNLLTLARNIGLNLTDSATPLKQIIMQYAMGLKGDLPPLAQI